MYDINRINWYVPHEQNQLTHITHNMTSYKWSKMHNIENCFSNTSCHCFGLWPSNNTVWWIRFACCFLSLALFIQVQQLNLGNTWVKILKLVWQQKGRTLFVKRNWYFMNKMTVMTFKCGTVFMLTSSFSKHRRMEGQITVKMTFFLMGFHRETWWVMYSCEGCPQISSWHWAAHSWDKTLWIPFSHRISWRKVVNKNNNSKWNTVWYRKMFHNGIFFIHVRTSPSLSAPSTPSGITTRNPKLVPQ